MAGMQPPEPAASRVEGAASSPTPRPAPIPAPDRHQIERLNTLYELDGPVAARGWRGRLAAPLRRFVARLLFRQQEFNSAVVDHINRNTVVAIEAHHASARVIEWVAEFENRLDAAVDEVRRYEQALAARERRAERAVQALADSHNELRLSIGSLQQAAQGLRREIAGMAEAGRPAAAAAAPPAPSVAGAQLATVVDADKYVGFEDQFRGAPEDIRRRVAEYLPIFQGADDVLDVGCGRGEFLALLREQGIRARGVDVNPAMVDVCRQQGLNATQADALTYLRQVPDGALGGLFAAQVVEHLEPAYLTALLDAAFAKLRPGAPLVLETINPACWFAFFESYIRDITHVRPVHPDTLQYLLIASGFQHVQVQYRAPYPEHDKLQPLPPHPALGDAVETLNANVERINRLLFTWLDYAAIGRRP